MNGVKVGATLLRFSLISSYRHMFRQRPDAVLKIFPALMIYPSRPLAARLWGYRTCNRHGFALHALPALCFPSRITGL